MQNGICDSTYALNNAIQAGTYSTTTAITDARYDLSTAIRDCCCNTQSAVQGLKYDMSRGFCDVVTANNMNTRDIIESQQSGTQRIIDFLCSQQTQNLRDQVQALQNAAVNNAQTQQIINSLQPVPRPAYVVQSPYVSSGYYGFGNGFAFGS
jgi:hypothetical protein